MKAIKIIKQTKKTKDGKDFDTYFGIIGDLKKFGDFYDFTKSIIRDVSFVKDFDINLNKLIFPITISDFSLISNENPNGNAYYIAKKDKNNQYIKNKDGAKIYKIYIKRVNNGQLHQSNTDDKIKYKPYQKITLESLLSSPSGVNENVKEDKELPF